MRKPKQRWGIGWALAYALACPAAALGGTVVADVTDGTLLRQVDASVRVETPLAASLLLVQVVHQALRAGALRPSTPVAIVPGPEAGRLPIDATHLTVDELLHWLLLTGDRTAANSLALAIGDSVLATRTRMLQTALRLGLTATTEPPNADAAATVDGALRTSAHDLARLGLTIARTPDMRSRLELDGVPIADGQFIVRATNPLFATVPLKNKRPAALALGYRDALEILAVATEPDAQAAAWATLADALDRYERRVIVHPGQEVGPLVDVRGGIIPRFTAIAAEQFAITVRRDVTPHITARLQLPTHVDAPIEVDEAVGELVLEQQGELVAVVPLVAPRAIAPRRWLGAMSTD